MMMNRECRYDGIENYERPCDIDDLEPRPLVILKDTNTCTGSHINTCNALKVRYNILPDVYEYVNGIYDGNGSNSNNDSSNDDFDDSYASLLNFNTAFQYRSDAKFIKFVHSNNRIIVDGEHSDICGMSKIGNTFIVSVEYAYILIHDDREILLRVTNAEKIHIIAVGTDCGSKIFLQNQNKYIVANDHIPAIESNNIAASQLFPANDAQIGNYIFIKYFPQSS